MLSFNNLTFKKPEIKEVTARRSKVRIITASKEEVKLKLPSYVISNLKSKIQHHPDSVKDIVKCVSHIEKACKAVGFILPNLWEYSEVSILHNTVWLKFNQGTLRVSYNFVTKDYEVIAFCFENKITYNLKLIKHEKIYSTINNSNA